MRYASAQCPYRLRRAPQHAVHSLLGRPVLHLGPGSARRESTCLAQIATTDSVDLHHSNTVVNTGYYGKGEMDETPGGSTTPVSVSPVAS